MYNTGISQGHGRDVQLTNILVKGGPGLNILCTVEVVSKSVEQGIHVTTLMTTGDHSREHIECLVTTVREWLVRKHGEEGIPSCLGETLSNDIVFWGEACKRNLDCKP